MERELKKLEFRIDMTMKNIEAKAVTPKDSGIGKLFNILKGLDEISYTQRLVVYKDVLKNLK